MSNRKSVKVPGKGHRGGAIPMGSRIGNIVYSSGIGTSDPDGGERTDDLDKPAENSVKNMKKFMELAGGTLGDNMYVLRMGTEPGGRGGVEGGVFENPGACPFEL